MSHLLDLIFPRTCPGCGELIRFRGFYPGEPEVFCPDCAPRWEDVGKEACGICAKPVSRCTCMPGPMKKAKIAGFCKLTYYHPDRQEHLENRVIYRLKNDSDTVMIRLLARELEGSIRSACGQIGFSPEECIVTYLPRGRAAVLKSGRDQAKLIASALAERLGVPMLRMIDRSFLRGGRSQKRLIYRERLRNVRESFRLRGAERVRGKYVLLVDDLVTTGAGMEVGASLLRRAGAKKILSVAVASDVENRYPEKEGSS